MSKIIIILLILASAVRAQSFFPYNLNDSTKITNIISVNSDTVFTSQTLHIHEAGYVDCSERGFRGRSLAFSVDSPEIVLKKNHGSVKFTDFELWGKAASGIGSLFMGGIEFSAGLSVIPQWKLYIETLGYYADKFRVFFGAGVKYKFWSN